MAYGSTVYRFQSHQFVHFHSHRELRDSTKQKDKDIHLSIMKKKNTHKSGMWKKNPGVYVQSAHCREEQKQQEYTHTPTN